MDNLKGQIVLVGVAVLGVAMILLAILWPGTPPPMPEDDQVVEQTAADPSATLEQEAEQSPTRTVEPADEPAHVRLFRAASAGDVRTIGTLLGMGVDVDTKASEQDATAVPTPPLETGMTALMLAARDSDMATANALLEAGADPNATTAAGMSPLMFAAQRDQADLVVALLGAGADPAEATPDGRTPLMLASRAGGHRTVALLIEAGADPNAADDQGVTPLMLAATGDHLDTVIVLLGAGANAAATDNQGRGSIERAEAGPVAEIIREAAGG